MSDLEHYLAPLSHLLFANRNLDIVLLCFILFGVAIYALNNRWRANRLERELTASRSNVTSAPAGRRYANAPTVEENEQEAGGLPPIKGGRTYARNQARRRHSFRAAFHRSRHRWSGCRADTLHSRVPFRRNPADPSHRRHSVRQPVGRRLQRRSLPRRAQVRW